MTPDEKEIREALAWGRSLLADAVIEDAHYPDNPPTAPQVRTLLALAERGSSMEPVGWRTRINKETGETIALGDDGIWIYTGFRAHDSSLPLYAAPPKEESDAEG